MEKQIKILEILQNQSDASSLYRGAGPNSRLSKDYPEIVFYGHSAHTPVEWHNIARMDIVFM